jgi:hypothetical protein
MPGSRLRSSANRKDRFPLPLAGQERPNSAAMDQHSDGGALFLRTYRHLYEEERREQAGRLDEFVRRHLDNTWTGDESEGEIPLNQGAADDGRTWDRTRDLPRVKRALSR